MKRFALLSVLFFSLVAKADPQSSEEMWKGSPYSNHVSLAVLQGVGFPSGSVGYQVNGYLGVKILHDGFVPDINDQVYIEGMFGGMFGGGGATLFSAHLRWDLTKDYLWTFYALGGMGIGTYGTAPFRATRFYPRVGVGAFWNLFNHLSFRAEVAQDMVAVGIATAF